MTLDFERAEPEASRFFPGGHIPELGEGLDDFVRMVEKLTQDELAIFSDEVKDFSPGQVENFCKNVVPWLNTEPPLAAIFHSQEVVAKMTTPVITQAFTNLYEKKYDCYIRKEFFEKALEKLAVHSPGSLSLLHHFMVQHISRGDRPEWFISDAADKGFARQIVAQSAAGPEDYRIASRQWTSLRRFELPETLGAYLKAKIVTGYASDLINLVGEMARDNLLSDKYIKVVRDIVGDDFFLKSCKSELDRAYGLYTTLQLAPIYGEAAIHDAGFLGGLQWGLNSDVPEYIKQFGQINFNEVKLPLLADYVVSKMNHMLKAAPDGIKDVDLQVRFCNLAGRLGKGDKALHRLAQILSPPDSDLRQPSRIFEAVLANQSSPAASLREEAAYNLLAKSISKLGLETLQRVAPDVSGRFVVDVLNWVHTDLNTREIIRLFPQAKGGLLENDLGL